jgi:hypothetical protein
VKREHLLKEVWSRECFIKAFFSGRKYIGFPKAIFTDKDIFYRLWFKILVYDRWRGDGVNLSHFKAFFN